MSEKWVIRKVWSHMWGNPGLYWSVRHSSLPDYFNNRFHFNSFEDAVEYACDHAKVAEHE